MLRLKILHRTNWSIKTLKNILNIKVRLFKKTTQYRCLSFFGVIKLLQLKLRFLNEAMDSFLVLCITLCSLKACLRKVNDTASRVVGQAFFNVIGVPCFEFAYEEQCAERHWYGM